MAQSIKIPVELELKQLQGSIQTLKNALEKVKPGTKVYENLSKSLDKIEHQFYSLENASKKSFKNVGEINAFEKAFEKVANSISDVASDFKRLNFEDLSSDLFSKDDIQRIQEASNKIKKVQTDIDNLRSDKFKEVASSSDEIKKAFSNLEIDIDTTNIDDAIKSIKNNLKSLSGQIGGKTRSINAKKNQLNLLETQAAAISSLRAGQGLTLAEKFGANFFDDTGRAFKDENSKQALVEMLAGLGLNKANLVKVQQSTAEDLDSFSDNIINTLRASAAQMKQDIEKITKTELPALELDKQQLTSTKAQQEAALKQLTAIDPSLTAELDNYKQQLNEAKNQLTLLKQELAQVRNGTDNYTKVVDDNNNALKQVSGSLENVKEQASNVARAQEKLADIKFAIKNWFGFNEVINLTKNAVRNMITQIRELDDVMTQIAIVTDMTQQELWDQMDTYSAMAQQYGASIKGVYEVSQLYYQQGLQTAEVMNLTEETLKMAKIANLDYAEATDYMTVALRGFKLEMSDAQQVTDVYSALAAATASDTEELAVAMSKTASSAEAVGSSFESTSAMIATMISITREAPENIGSALKSIISRYGEMTSDPTAMIDSEGEEMSLNKVDKALQSVGISLQNAQGQFRDFDDVILELSKSWDTIDTNTQRYIATVMAGNRQQSRFLALVGNYEEYAKALEVAENAEDAGTLQTLKTMDSISTKWEQLKVSLQEFYTSAGLEDVFKGVLDALTAFLTKANDIPKLFGKIPVSVIALVSSLITSIKNVATSLTSAVMGPIAEIGKKLDELKNKSPLEIKVVTKADVSSVDTTVNELDNALQQRSPLVVGKKSSLDPNKKQALQNYFNDLDDGLLGTTAQSVDIAKVYNLNGEAAKKFKQELNGLTKEQREALLSGKSLDEVLGKMPKTLLDTTSSTSTLQTITSKVKGVFGKYSGVIGMATSALSAYLLTLKDSSSATVEASKTSSGLINTLAGAGRMWAGDYIGGALQLISGIPTLLDGLFYTVEERYERSLEEFNNLNNDYLQKKENVRTTENNIKELERLAEARFENAEAMQEYLDYSAQIADSNPELISGYDAEGNAIIDLTTHYENLKIAKLQAAEAGLEASSADLLASQYEIGTIQKNQKEVLGKITPKYFNEAVEDAYNSAVTNAIEETVGNNTFRGEGFILDSAGAAQTMAQAGGEHSYQTDTDILNFLGNFYTTPQEIEDFASVYTGVADTEEFEKIKEALLKYQEEDEEARGTFAEYFKNFLNINEESLSEEALKIVDATDLQKQQDSFALGLNNLKNLTGENLVNSARESLEAYNNIIKNYYKEIDNTKDTKDKENLKEELKTFEENNKENIENLQQIIDYEYELVLAQNTQSQKQKSHIASYVYSKYVNAINDGQESLWNFYENSTSAIEVLNNKLMAEYKASNTDLDIKEWLLTVDANNIISTFSQIFENISEEEGQAVDELVSKRDNYSTENYKQALLDIGLSEQQIDYYLEERARELKNTADLTQRIGSVNKDRRENNLKVLDTSYGLIQDFLSEASKDALFSLEKQLYKQIDSGAIEFDDGQNFINNITQAYKQAIQLGPEQEAKITDILNKADLFSLDGIYSAIDQLREAGASEALISQITNLADYINVNVYTEWQTFGQKVKDGLETFTEALTNATEGMDFDAALAMAEKTKLSLGKDFRFEDGEYFLDNITAIQESYSNFGDELKQKLIDQTETELEFLEVDLADASTDEGYQEISAKIAEIKLAQENALAGVDQYITYHTNIAYLTAGLYEAFLTAVAGEDSKLNEKELLAAARQGEQALRDYVAKSGEDFEEGYYSAILESVSSTNDDILSAVLEAKVSKGGTAYISELIKNTDLDLEKYQQITSKNINELFTEMYGSNYEAYNDAMLQYMEDGSADISGMIADLAGDIEHIDYSSVFEIANALGRNINEIIGLFTDNFDGTFSTSLNNIQALAQMAGIGITSEIQDTIREYLDNILGIVSNGISGSMTNVEFDTLENFMGLDLDFTKTSEGLKLTKASAIEVYTELKKIDSIQAQITFSDLAESLEEAGSGYEDVASTMQTIAELNRELADVPVSSERRKELERELSVAEEILRVRSQDPDSFSFMDKDLPTGMQGPENYWNSVGEAYKVMNEAASSGYMEIQDYVNIVRQMEAMATAAGQDFSIGGMNAAALIQKGLSSLSNIDGEGVKIAMEGVGIDFASAATDMGLSFDDGIKEMAKSQIKMLDAAIRMLEAMVAMENIDANSDGFLEMGEIFANGVDLSEGWDKDVIEWADNLEDAAGKIDIGGKSLLEALATLEPEQIRSALNALMSIDWTLGDTDIASQIQNVLSAYFPDVDITQGKSVFDILEVPDDADKNAEHFTKWLNDMGLNARQYEDLMRYLDENTKIIGTGGSLFKSIAKMLGIEEGTKQFDQLTAFTNSMYAQGFGIQDVIKVWDDITVTEDNGKTTYTYNGQEYTDLNQVLAARTLTETTGRDVLGKEIKTNKATGETIYASGTINIGGEEILVEGFESGNTWYSSAKTGARKFKSLNELLEESFKMDQESGSTEMTKAEYFASYGVDITAEGLANVSVEGIKEVLSSDIISQKVQEAGGTKDIVIPIDGKDVTFAAGTSETEIQQKLMEAIGVDAAQMETIVTAISTAISTADWSPVGKAISEALTGKVKTEEGVSEGIEIGELTLKPTGLKVDATDIEPTLSSGEEALSNIPIASLTLTPNTLHIDIVNKTPQLKEGQTVTIENIPSATGIVTGSITITNNGEWKAAIGQTSPEVTGYTSANGTVETVTINGASFKVVPVEEAPTNLEGELNPVESGFVKVNGNYYSVDLSSGQQLNPGMNLDNVSAGSAQVNATSYTVTFTNAEGTATQSVIVQGEAQLNAVLQNATLADDGSWKISSISAEVDASISAKSENALVSFFNTLVNKLKNIEVTYQEPTPAGEYSKGEGSYSYKGWDVLGNYGIYSGFSSFDDALKDLASRVNDTNFFNEGTYTIEKIDANGSVIETASVTVTSNGTTISGNTSTSSSKKSGGGSGSGSSGTNSGNNGGEAGAIVLPPVDTSVAEESVQSAVIDIEADLASAGSSGGASAAAAIQETLDGIKSKSVRISVNYPSSVTIGAHVNVDVSVTGDATAKASASIYRAGAKGNVAFAKGNLSGKALASGTRKTLMGELGPELVVSDGRYFLVGQNGAEFVDLADDAIVFNHLQTAKLIKHGRAGTGKPVTNETNAVSFATGNVDGPAMASASAALAQLRQIRAMWQALLDASIADLGAKAGMGKGGGGGGGRGGDTDNSAVPYDLEKWYNWLRKIAQLEKEITLEQAKRENMASGYDRADSLSRELSLLEKQLAVEKDLAEEQEAYYKARADEVNKSAYGQIFTFDENGLMQFREEEGLGLDFITKIKNEEKATEQLKIIAGLGFDTGNDLLYDENGQKIDISDMKPEEVAKAKVENFFNNVDLTKEELEELYDSVYEHQIKIEELATAQLEIQQERVDNQLEVEQMIYDTIVDMKEAEIKGFEEQKEAIQEASEDYLEGLNKALDKELAMYNKNAEQEETTKLQRRLSILQRSGGSASEIRSLQEQIDSRLKDEYFQEQQDQIDAIQEASDREIERLDKQINILTETLDYEKENGLIWDQVAEWLQKPEDEILSFITSWNEEFLNSSLLGQEEFFKEAQKILQQYFGDQKWIQAEEAAEKYVSEMTQEDAKYHGASDDIIAQAKEAYKNSYYENQDSTKAEANANAFLDKALQNNTPSPSTGEETDEFVTISAKVKGGQMNLREGPNKNTKSLARIKDGQSFEVVGYNGDWMKVENAGKNKLSGYMRYGNYEKYYSGLSKEELKKVKPFSKGGVVDYTGLAMVHGSKSKPESFISAEHTKLLKSTIFSPHNNALEKLREVYENYKSTSGASSSNDSNINIENINISVETGAISNEYDARRAGQEIFDEMVRISRKTANVKVSRR